MWGLETEGSSAFSNQLCDLRPALTAHSLNLFISLMGVVIPPCTPCPGLWGGLNEGLGVKSVGVFE